MTPSLEIRIPISPTPQFFTMVHYLVESLQCYGGPCGQQAHVVVTVGADEPPRDLGKELPWSADYPLEWRWADRALFKESSYSATCFERFTYPFKADMVLMLDADILVTGPLDEIVQEAFQRQCLMGLIAHISPFAQRREIPNRIWWERVFQAAGLALPDMNCRHIFWEEGSDAQYQYGPPYFNFGAVLAPRAVMETISRTFLDEQSTVDEVLKTAFNVQLALALAIQRHHIPWQALDLKYNFPTTVPRDGPVYRSLTGSALADVRIWHYCWKGQIDKEIDFGDPASVQKLLGRTDLNPVLKVFQQRLKLVHDRLLRYYPMLRTEDFPHLSGLDQVLAQSGAALAAERLQQRLALADVSPEALIKAFNDPANPVGKDELELLELKADQAWRDQRFLLAETLDRLAAMAGNHTQRGSSAGRKRKTMALSTASLGSDVASRAVIITGMHRSGTSLVASLLQRAGLAVGERLLPPDRSNPRGFFEDMDFYQFHDEILSQRGQSILVGRDFAFEATGDERDKARALIGARQSLPQWGWKDPRTSLFLDFWDQLLPQAVYVFVFRHPLDVLLSLVRRHEVSNPGLLEGLEAWYAYNLRIREFAAHHPQTTVVCHIHGLLEQIDQFGALVGAKFGLQLELNTAMVKALYRPEELGRAVLTPAVEAWLAKAHPEAMRLYADLNAAADLPEPARQVEAALLPPEGAQLVDVIQNLPEVAGSTLRRGLLMTLLAYVAPEAVEDFYAACYQDRLALAQGAAWWKGQAHNWQEVADKNAQANTWLNQQYQMTLQENTRLNRLLGTLQGRPEGEQTELFPPFAFLENFSQGQLLAGCPEQMAIWDVALDGQTSRALFQQPPAKYAFELPHGEAGYLSVAVALHPEVWTRPDSGGCLFVVVVDERIALQVAINPLQRPGDRHWRPYLLSVPANPRGRHQVVFETSTIGPTADFRWALWRDPQFLWTRDFDADKKEHVEMAEKTTREADVISARDTLRAALDLSPNDPQLIVAYGAALLQQGETEAARREFVKATVLAPTYVLGHVSLAAVQLSLGDQAAASASVRRALALDADDADARRLAEFLAQNFPGLPAAAPEVRGGNEAKPTPASAEARPEASALPKRADKLARLVGTYEERAALWGELGAEHIIRQLCVGSPTQPVARIPKPPATPVDGAELPLPPPHLRMGYCINDDKLFLQSGRQSHAALCQILESQQVHLGPGDALLDWGCATGRVLRFFADLAPAVEVWGSDVDAPSMEWCVYHLAPPFKFFTGTSLPHLPFPDEKFKFVYGMSVFTHLTSLRDMWLLELARILKPGGCAILTIHDEHSWATFREKGMPGWMPPALAALPSLPDYGLEIRGNFWYETYTFFHSDYIRKFWGQYFEVADIVPGAEGYQTAVVLRKH